MGRRVGRAVQRFVVVCLSFVTIVVLPLTASATCDPSGSPFGGGSGTSVDPYRICSPTQLNAIGNSYLTAHFSLATDIDLAGVSNFNVIGAGSFANRFQGTFNGNGHTIGNLTVSCVTYCALIGFLGGTISDVRFSNASITASDGASAIAVGNADHGTISDIVAEGTVVGTLDRLGLVFGSAFNTSISDCYGSGSVSGRDSIGGIGGHLSGASTLVRSAATVSASGRQDVGGVVGIARFNSSGSPSISEVRSDGTVAGTLNAVGGVVGFCSGCQLSDALSSASVSNSSSSAGGSVGEVEEAFDPPFSSTSSEVLRLFSYGPVTSATPSAAGGSVGSTQGTNTSSNLFWDETASGNTTSALGTALTTSQARSAANFTGFNFSTVWGINEGSSYPFLRNAGTPVPTATPTPTVTATPTPTATPTATATSTATPTPTSTATPTATSTATPIPTVTPTAMNTATPVPPTPTAAPTVTPTPACTSTPATPTVVISGRNARIRFTGTRGRTYQVTARRSGSPARSAQTITVTAVKNGILNVRFESLRRGIWRFSYRTTINNRKRESCPVEKTV